MLHVVTSANVPQKVSDAGASQAGGGDGAALDPAGPGGFGALLASQIKGVIAQLRPGVGEEGLSAGKAALGADRKASTDDQSAAVNPVLDPMGLVQVVPLVPVILQNVQVVPAGDQTAQVGLVKEGGRSAGGDREVLGLAVGRPSDSQIHPAAEFAVDGKNLPLALSDKPAPDRSGIDLTAALSAGFDARKPQAHADSAVQVRTDGVVGANAAPVPVQQTPTVVVTPRVGSADWGGAVSEKVVWMANQNHQVAELHLNPPNLGPVEVRLTINNDQASATFVAHHPVVRDAIETALPRLREMLADSGIMLGNATVSSESFAQQQQASDQGGRSGSDRRGGGVQQTIAGAVPDSGGVSRRSLLDGMVDTFA